MSKNKKFIFTSVISILLFTYIGTYLKKPALSFPYPYSLNITSKSMEIKKLIEDKPPVILIIGDRMAKNLAQFAELLSESLSEGYESKVNIGWMANEKEPIYRTVEKIKKYPFSPKIIIYYGASTEFSEDIFNINELKTILNNFEIYNDSLNKTLVQISPLFGKILYRPFSYISLNDDIIESTLTEPTKVLSALPVYYKIFEQSLIDLILIAKEKNSQLFLLTTPINYDIIPRNDCNDENENFTVLVNKIKNRIDSGDYKSSFAELLLANKDYPTSSKINYLLGKVYYKLGQLEKGEYYFSQASALECIIPWRGNAIFNHIIINTGKNYEASVFNFHRMLQVDWDKNILFQDEIFPQDLYIEKLIKELSKAIKYSIGQTP